MAHSILPAEREAERVSKMEGANWMDIRSDRQKGLSYTEIARKYNIDPRMSARST